MVCRYGQRPPGSASSSVNPNYKHPQHYYPSDSLTAPHGVEIGGPRWSDDPRQPPLGAEWAVWAPPQMERAGGGGFDRAKRQGSFEAPAVLSGVGTWPEVVDRRIEENRVDNEALSQDGYADEAEGDER